MDVFTKTFHGGRNMNFVFGICMGAVIFRLFDTKEYAHAILAMAAFVIGLAMIVNN